MEYFFLAETMADGTTGLGLLRETLAAAAAAARNGSRQNRYLKRQRPR